MVSHLLYSLTKKFTIFMVLSLTFANTLNLREAINLAVNNPEGEYVRSLKEESISQINLELYRRKYDPKMQIAFYRTNQETGLLDSEENKYELSDDNDSMANLSLANELSGALGSLILLDMDFDVKKYKVSSLRDDYSLKSSAQLSFTQPLTGEAIKYNESLEQNYVDLIHYASIVKKASFKKIMLTVIAQYKSLYLLQKQIDLEKEQYELMKDLKNELENFVKFGKKTKMDLDQMKIEVLKSKIRITQLEREHQNQMRQMNILLGLELKTSSVLLPVNLSQPEETIDIEKINIQNQEQLALKSINIKTKQREKLKILSEDSPSFKITSYLSWENKNDAFKNLLNQQNNHSYQYVFEFSFPFLNMTRRKDSLLKNRSETDILKRSYQKAKKEYIHYVINLQDQLKSIRNQLELTERSIEMQKKLINVKKTQYKNGSVLLSDLLTDQYSLKETHIQRETLLLNQFEIFVTLLSESQYTESVLLSKLDINVTEGGLTYE